MRAEKPVQPFQEEGWDTLIVYVGGILDLEGNSLRFTTDTAMIRCMLLGLCSTAAPL